MHTANGVSIMLPIAAYEHLSKNWEWECDPEFLQLEKNKTLQQGCRFVPSTFSETIRHRWYLWIYCKYWFPPGFGGLIQGPASTTLWDLRPP